MRLRILFEGRGLWVRFGRNRDSTTTILRDSLAEEVFCSLPADLTLNYVFFRMLRINPSRGKRMEHHRKAFVNNLAYPSLQLSLSDHRASLMAYFDVYPIIRNPSIRPDVANTCIMFYEPAQGY